MHNDVITIIVLCYNHESFLEQSINAVYAQTYTNIQLIVTDDCSIDGSVALIQQLKAERNFETVINEKNIGLNATLARALALAKGEYIAIISADDYMLPHKTATEYNFLKQHDFEAVYANGFSVENNNQRLIKLNPVFQSGNNKAILEYVYQYDWGAPLLQSGLFHKTVWVHTLPLRVQYKSDDWAFLIYTFQHFKTGFINEPVFCYRLHANNTFKKYWFTFPMRMDVVSTLVPEAYRVKATANMLLSQGQYIMQIDSFFQGLKMQFAAIVMNFSGKNIIAMLKSIATYFKNKFVSIS